MTDKANIDGEQAEQGPAIGSGIQRSDRCIAMLRSALAGTRLLDHVVRSLFKRVDVLVSQNQTFISFLLLKPRQVLMLAGIRCAGAGGGGPGH